MRQCECKSQKEARQRHKHVRIERRADGLYLVWADPERERIQSGRHQKRPTASAKLPLGPSGKPLSKADCESRARKKAKEIADRLEARAAGAPQHSDEPVVAAIERYLRSLQPWSSTNPEGRKGLVREPLPTASAAKHAAYAAWLRGRDVNDPKIRRLRRPVSEQTLCTIKRSLRDLAGWLRGAVIKDISGEALFAIEVKLVNQPTKAGGEYDPDSTRQRRAHIRAFVRWLGASCPGSQHLDALPQTTRSHERPGIEEVIERARPLGSIVGGTVIGLSRKEHDELEREVRFARALIQAALLYDGRVEVLEIADRAAALERIASVRDAAIAHDKPWAAPFASLLLLAGPRPIEVHRLRPEYVMENDSGVLLHLPHHATKTWSPRVLYTDISPGLSMLLRALHGWCGACGSGASAKIKRQALSLGGYTDGNRHSRIANNTIRQHMGALGYQIEGDIWKRCRSLSATIVVAAGLLTPEQAAVRAGHGPELRFSSYVRSLPLRGQYATLEGALHIEPELELVMAALQARTTALGGPGDSRANAAPPAAESSPATQSRSVPRTGVLG
jgi:hypothetical protein